jgi:DNA polymerase-3 subunit alpha
VDLFGNALDNTDFVKPQLALEAAPFTYPIREQLAWERELLGLYLSQHPLEAFELILAEQTTPLSTLKAEHDGKSVSIGGAVMEMREIMTKKGQKMAFAKIADQFSELEVILFPSIYQQTIGIWERDRIVLVKGKINAKDRDGNITSDLKILVDDAREITSEQAAAYQATGKKKKVPKPNKKVAMVIKKTSIVETVNPRLYIRVEKSDDTDTLMSLKSTIDSKRGETEVVLVVGPEASKQIIRLPMRVHADEAMSALSELVGTDNIKLH